MPGSRRRCTGRVALSWSFDHYVPDYLPLNKQPFTDFVLQSVSLCVSVCMVVCVLPCDGLVTCPGCTPPPAHRLLEIGTSIPATHYGRSSIEND
ncbi:hypothetical protein ILYODFUR_025172 [Ilyodon furcidens]|uniref:Uncharacterized protein n=1 Tax=Ilyodon furcidens TaxID=33524 RepID=A0ABV0TBA6_9TELE